MNIFAFRVAINLFFLLPDYNCIICGYVFKLKLAFLYFMKTKDLFVTHLLFPIITLVMVAAMIIINKKDALLSTKALIAFVLIGSLVIALPGVATLLGPGYIPLIYIYIQIIYIGIGYIYMTKVTSYFSGEDEWYNKGMILLCTLAILCLGSYLFSLVFNYLGEFSYGLMASTATYTFILPLLVKWAYNALLEIPTEIFKIWKYNPHYREPDFTSETIDIIRLLEVELSKTPDDQNLIKVKAKAPVMFTFGDWFQMFIHDYNQKYLENPIHYKSNDGELYSWIFYIKPSVSMSKKYIDHEVSIAENGIEEKYTIICKRVDKTF